MLIKNKKTGAKGTLREYNLEWDGNPIYYNGQDLVKVDYDGYELEVDDYEIINNNTEVIKQIEERMKEYENMLLPKEHSEIILKIYSELRWVLQLLKESE